MACTSRPGILSKRFTSGLLALGALLVGVNAHADGGIPRAVDILFEPGNPSDIVIRSDFWGLFRSKDAGKTWQYACSELFGGNSKQGSRNSVLVAKGGRILVAAQFKGMQMTDDLCSWHEAPSLSGHLVQSVTSAGTDFYALSADGVTSDSGASGVVSEVWRSTDGGDTWKAFGTRVPGNFSGASLAFAPSDDQRVYVLGTELQSQKTVMVHSIDGASSWVSVPITTADPGAQIRIQAVHPKRPDVVFVWMDSTPPSAGQVVPDEVWGTKDGGATWSKVYTGKGDLPGLAISPDGTQVLISGPEDGDGIQGATVDDALSQGQAAFHPVFTGKVWGLTWNDGGLFAGNNNFTGRDSNGTPLPAYTLGVSNDEGKTFSPLMSVCQLEYATCPSGTDMDQACHGPFYGLGGYEIDYLKSSRCAAATTSDAGAKADAGASSSAPAKSGCSCSVPGAGASRLSASAPALLVALGLLARRRRTSRTTR
jgi:MYXO-CTERM domain-containing protein